MNRPIFNLFSGSTQIKTLALYQAFLAYLNIFARLLMGFLRNELEAFTYGLKTQMASEEFSKDFSAEEQSEINDSIEKTIEWLEINDHESPETYNQKKIDLENLIKSFKTEREREEL